MSWAFSTASPSNRTVPSAVPAIWVKNRLENQSDGRSIVSCSCASSSSTRKTAVASKPAVMPNRKPILPAMVRGASAAVVTELIVKAGSPAASWLGKNLVMSESTSSESRTPGGERKQAGVRDVRLQETGQAGFVDGHGLLCIKSFGRTRPHQLRASFR